MPRPTPLPLRAMRTVRVAAHLVTALAITAFVFPMSGRERRDALTRNWSKRLLRMLGIDARIHGPSPGDFSGNMLIVANHISWLDIFVVNSVRPARFVAKSELRRWPLVGRIMTNAGTLYVERTRRHDTHKVNRRASEALANGDVLAIFPEGVTTDGTTLLPFHGSLLQPIVDAEGHVLPVALRYRTHDDRYSGAPAYDGDTTLWQSFWRLTGERSLVVELHVSAPMPARQRHRRQLARDSEAAIRTALASAASAPAPGTRGDPEGGSP